MVAGRTIAGPGNQAGRQLSFGSRLAVVALVGGVIRVAYVLLVRASKPLVYDGPSYRAGAVTLLRGYGFANPESLYFRRVLAPGALHPPLNMLWLALGQLVGMRSETQAMLWEVLLGTATVALVGLLGREIAGPVVGIVAAVFAAIYADFWAYDALAMAETPTQFCVALSLLLAYRFAARPTAVRAGALAGATALAALARSEAVVLLIVLVVPLMLVVRRPWRARLVYLAAAGVWASAVLLPWVGWNLVRFDPPATLATGLDISVAYGNCLVPYYTDRLGSYDFFCAYSINHLATTRMKDESSLGQEYRKQGLDYARAHADRVPIVLAARVGRVLDVYQPVQQAHIEHDQEGRELWVAYLALGSYSVLVPLALVGAWQMRKRHRLLFPLVVTILPGVMGALVTFGTVRYRCSAEPALVVAAAVGVVWLWRRWGGRRYDGGPSAVGDLGQ